MDEKVKWLGMTVLCMPCRDAMKKAVEAVKAASQMQTMDADSAELLARLSDVEQLVKAATAESLPALLEGMQAALPRLHLLNCAVHDELTEMTQICHLLLITDLQMTSCIAVLETSHM